MNPRIQTMRRHLLAVAAAACMTQPVAAAVLQVDCPPLVPSGFVPAPGFPFEIITRERGAPAPAAGPATVHPLNGVQVYAGHPRDMASLVPDEDKPLSNGARESVWRLTGNHWVGCSYPGASLVLARPLPASATECRASYRVTRGVVRVTAFACRG